MISQDKILLFVRRSVCVDSLLSEPRPSGASSEMEQQQQMDPAKVAELQVRAHAPAD